MPASHCVNSLCYNSNPPMVLEFEVVQDDLMERVNLDVTLKEVKCPCVSSGDRIVRERIKELETKPLCLP